MKCCSPHANSTNRFFSFFAKRYRARFSKKGFEKSQRQLLEGILQARISDNSILEIGCGVGHFHQSLLERGASNAIGIDLAAAMIEQAEDWAKQRGLSTRSEYYTGDFQHIYSDIPNLDITILDKVICCDPNADQLLESSLSKTNKIYALTFPRKRWSVSIGIGIAALLMKLFLSNFRPYLHDPKLIEEKIISQGFRKQYEAKTFVWQTQVYVCVD